ncbi:EamA family transporter [Acetobacter sp. TBRC 12305]|uniref:EamA family transporter n=1 Tax=Acetobacter garciniae TaxID=2817435 RepID=A0A939HQB0_9PROT|nr:EamA family transporter [Acetobacter garciniae]MBX0345357.1 EamA family transporter [Acetobacter garciniae]
MGAYGHLVAIYLIWGSTYLASKICLSGPHAMSVLQLQITREIIGASVLGALSLLRHGWPAGVRGRDIGLCLFCGVLLWCGGNTLATACARYTSSGFIVMAMGVIPLWTALFDSLFGGGRISRRMVLSLLTGLAGLAMVVWPTFHGGQAGNGQGHPLLIMLVLQLGAMSWAAGTVLQRPLAARFPGGLIASAQLATGAVGLSCVALAIHDVPHFDVGPQQWGALAFLVLFGSVIAPSSYVAVVRTFRPEIASTFAYVNPIVGVCLGSLILGERPALLSLVGMVVILGSVALLLLPTRLNIFGGAGRRKTA